MNKSKEELIEEKIKCEKEMEILEHQNQRLTNRIEYLTKGDRAKRTHRLCEKGGAIESICPETKDMVNFRTRKQSYKSKKKIENPPEMWKIFRNTHEAIIDEETFARVQELRQNKRRPTRTGKTNMFSGIARCADCGEKLYYCTMNNYETRQDHFVCSTSRKKGTDVCDSHFIRAVVLEEGTLQNIQLVCLCVSAFEDEFREALGALKSSEAKKELDAKKRQLQKSENRHSELDRLFKRIYEDRVNGNLSETRFKMLSDDYETEQAELKEKIELLKNEIQGFQEKTDNIEKFIRTAKKYVGIEKLTPAILNDMVKAVYVHKTDKSSCKRVQTITISYNYAGILPNSLLNKFYSRCTQKETA